MTEAGATDLGASTVSGTLGITSGGAVTDSGTLAITGATTISASGQDITLDEAASTFGTLALTGANVAVTDAGATDLGASTVSGTLGITSGGAVTDSGTLAITGATTISASGQDITLDEAASTFGTLALTGANVAVTDAGATDLGASTVSGTLAITSIGDVTNSGVLDIAGDLALTTSADNGSVSLDQANDIDGVLSVTTHGTGTTSVTNLTGSIDLGTITTAELTIDARGITQSGVSTVSGVSSFTSGANAISLDQANEFTGAVNLSNSGANNVTIDDANDLVLGTVSIAAGDLNVDNAGTITQTGVVSVGGNTVLDNSDGDNADITLANANNVYTGTVTFSTDTGSDISIADSTAFDLGALAVNSLIVSAGGDISDSGVLDIATTASFTTTAANGNLVLDQASDIDGAFSIATHGTGTSSVTNLTDAIELGTVSSAGLTIEADGAISQSGAATISGDASFTNTDGDNAAISLNNASNSFGGSIALATDSGSAVTLTDTTAIELPALTLASLTVTSGGAVTDADAGTLVISGATSVSASGQDITLDSDASTFGDLSLVGTNVAVTENGAMNLAAANISGTATFNSSDNAITDSGTLTIAGASTFNSGTANLDLNEAGSTFGDLSITAAEAYVADDGSLTASSIQANKVQLKGGSGVSATSTGVAEFAAESDSGNISITNTGGYAISDFASTAGITGVRFTDADATGTITLIANSPLTINAPVDAGNGALQLTAAGSASTDDVTINAALSGDSVAVSAGDSIAITAGGVTSSTLALTAVSNISLDAPVTSITANLQAGNQISLDSGAQVSSSNFNITSTKLSVAPSASVPAFNFSGGAEGDPSFDRNGRVQEATQSDWNTYFRVSETIELDYDSAGDVVLDQLVVSLISNEASPVNSGEVELEEE